MPFDVNVQQHRRRARGRRGGAANGGIAIDTWHMSKLGIAPGRAAPHPARAPVAGSSSATAAVENMDDPIDEVVNHRELPGEGEFDIRGYIAACQAHGLRRAVGRRGALRGAPQPAHERDLPAGLRDDRRPVPRREEPDVSALRRSTATLIWVYEQMLRIREFEERVKRTFLEHPGVIRGHTHLADGAEASIVGSIATLGPDDQFFTTYRCHGYPIARGTDPKAMMAEIYGRKDGLCKGIGGSMHLTDVSNGLPRHVGHRRRRHPACRRRRLGGPDPQAGPGRPLLLRRRRVEAGRVRRDAQHRVAVEAPDRVRDGEQRLQRPHALGSGGCEPRQRRGSLRSRPRPTACPA